MSAESLDVQFERSQYIYKYPVIWTGTLGKIFDR